MAKKPPVEKPSQEKPAEKPAEESPAKAAAEDNRCFIITPIGDENSEIRRGTDGLIDAVIDPVLREHGLEPVAPHRDYDPRSITTRIVANLVESRLVVANLTGLNPNVMYELAVRHAVAKPVVCVAEYGTRLPFDIKDELTIFYANDMRGVVDLREQLSEAIRHAIAAEKCDNALLRYRQTALLELSGEAPNALEIILERLDAIESQLAGIKSKDTGQLGPAVRDRQGTLSMSAPDQEARAARIRVSKQLEAMFRKFDQQRTSGPDLQTEIPF